jgi:hypothetical protein
MGVYPGHMSHDKPSIHDTHSIGRLKAAITDLHIADTEQLRKKALGVLVRRFDMVEIYTHELQAECDKLNRQMKAMHASSGGSDHAAFISQMEALFNEHHSRPSAPALALLGHKRV